MNKILIILSLVLLAACGPSQEDKETIAAVTCSIIGETRGMDAAIRVREMNKARVEIGGEPFLGGDDAIKESLEWGLCQELVLNESYDETLQSLKDANREMERIAAEKRAEEKRIAAEKRAEEERIAAEKQAKIRARYNFALECSNEKEERKKGEKNWYEHYLEIDRLNLEVFQMTVHFNPDYKLNVKGDWVWYREYTKDVSDDTPGLYKWDSRRYGNSQLTRETFRLDNDFYRTSDVCKLISLDDLSGKKESIKEEQRERWNKKREQERLKKEKRILDLG